MDSSEPRAESMHKGLFRLIVGYDGSVCAENALSDLQRAGLPAAVEAMVVSVADVLLPPQAEPAKPSNPDWLVAALERARAQAKRTGDEAYATALRGKQTLERAFPGWQVSAEALADSPGWGLIKKADEWNADLLVVGSHSRPTLERLLLGSVAQTVVRNASCSVRIARELTRKNGSPVRLVAGDDGSPDAEAVLRAIASRQWPAGSTLLLVTAIDPLLSTAITSPDSRAHSWVGEDDKDDRDWVRKMNQAAANKLSEAGLLVSTLAKEGDPRRVLVEETERFEADCIFVGARGLRGIERLLLGSVSSAVAARAHCSVEVVRSRATGS